MKAEYSPRWTPSPKEVEILLAAHRNGTPRKDVAKILGKNIDQVDRWYHSRRLLRSYSMIIQEAETSLGDHLESFCRLNLNPPSRNAMQLASKIGAELKKQSAEIKPELSISSQDDHFHPGNAYLTARLSYSRNVEAVFDQRTPTRPAALVREFLELHSGENP